MTFFKLLENEKSYLEILKQNKMFVKNKAKVTVEEGPPPTPTKKTEEEMGEQFEPYGDKEDEEDKDKDEEVEEKWIAPRGSTSDKMDARTMGSGDTGPVSGGPSDVAARRQAYKKQRSKWQQEQNGVIKRHSKPEDQDSDDVS